jgi:hypothetical protein
MMAKADDFGDPCIERFQRTRCCVNLGVQPFGRTFSFTPVKGAQKLVLGFKVTTERTRRQIGLAQNLCHRCVLKPVARHNGQCRVEDDMISSSPQIAAVVRPGSQDWTLSASSRLEASPRHGIRVADPRTVGAAARMSGNSCTAEP